MSKFILKYSASLLVSLFGMVGVVILLAASGLTGLEELESECPQTQALISLAAAHGVAVKVNSNLPELGAVYVDKLNLIVVSPEGRQLVILAHEVGHVVAGLQAGFWCRFKSGLGVQSPKIQAEEVAAWDAARGILQSLGYEDWGTFTELRQIGLGSYGVKE